MLAIIQKTPKHPVPNNIKGVYRMNTFVQDVLKEKGENNEVLIESILEKVHHKIRNEGMYAVPYLGCGPI